MLEKLRLALFSFELDEPHDADEINPHLPEITEEQFQECLTMEHCGDCVNLPTSCPRCYAEDIDFKARWLVKKIS